MANLRAAPMTRLETLGWIGFGQFGRFAATALRSKFEILAADRRPIGELARETGVREASLAEVAGQPVVVLAVPVQALPDLLDAIAPQLQPGALVIDVCSVKVAPLRWMQERLPPEVEYLGTHPMFGPQSAADGLDGHTVVVCPGRTERMGTVCSTLESFGLDVVVADADTHDRQAAYTQALAQYVGRAIRDLEGADHPIGTPAAERLREVARIVGDDSEELFHAIQELNPYARQMRRELRERLETLDRGLTRGQPEAAR